MKAWDLFLGQQEQELGTETVQKWLRTLKILRFDACNLYLEAKDSFQVLWFEEHVRKKVQKLVNNNGKKIKVHLSTTHVENSALKTKLKSEKGISPLPQFVLNFDELDPLCTFENFVLTPSSTLAYKLLTNIGGLSLEKAPELATFNPVFIHGCSGTGKTHLLMATAETLRKRGYKVLYVRAETFTEHVVKAIRAGEMSYFRQAYRNIDVLIIDDVHIFSRKSATQEELFHTFNTQHLGGKQIILASNCSPSELQLIEPRLVSRFEWGIVLSLEPLNETEIKTVLEKKSAALNFPLHGKVSDFLLETFATTKTLNRALQALILRAHIHEEGVLTIAKVKHLLADLIQEEEKNALTSLKLMQFVAEHFGIIIDDLQGKAQTRDSVLPRQLAMYFCRQTLHLPFIKIGELFDRDHSTVISSVKVIQKGIEEDNLEIVRHYNALLKKIYSANAID